MTQTIQPSPENSAGRQETATPKNISPEPTSDDVLSEPLPYPRYLNRHVGGTCADFIIEGALAQLAAVQPSVLSVFTDVADTCRVRHLPPPTRSSINIHNAQLNRAHLLGQSKATPEIPTEAPSEKLSKVSPDECAGQLSASHPTVIVMASYRGHYEY